MRTRLLSPYGPFRSPYDDLCIHLDTYFTRVDYETFLVARELLDQARVYRITRGRSEGTTRACHVAGGLKEALRLALGSSSLQFILCGGSNPGAAEVERTNNATSTLCLEPGKVCVYEEKTPKPTKRWSRPVLTLFPSLSLS